jgi:hypothetical protein
VFSEYTKILMEEGRVHESEVEDLLLEGFVGAATWMRSPGIFEFELGGETIGASPDAILWLDRHHIPIEVKWHAKGECKYPMPCNYFAQLYTQMMATRATLGVYLGVAPSGEMCCTVLQRLAEVDDKFEEQVLWYRSERKMYERGVRKRYSEAIDKIDELRIKSIVFQKRSTADLLRFLRERTKQHDKDGTTDDFDPERNAVPPTRASTPACAPRSPHPLPLPRGHSNSPPLVGGRSRSASPRTRRVPTRELGESVVEGNAEVEGAS